MFVVSLDKFNGPLGLLLQMIESEKLDITEISLAKIADEYVEYVKNNENIKADEIADFLIVAAKLLWLKSKALLPYIISDEKEEETDDLEKQLKMYKEFADASLVIADIIALGNYQYTPKFNKQNRQKLFNLPLFIKPKNLNPDILKTLMLDLIAKISEEKPLEEERIEESISIEDKISFIRQTIKEQISFSFNSLIKKGASKTEMIVSLLAILELIKQKEIEFEQEALFSEILLLRPNSQ